MMSVMMRPGESESYYYVKVNDDMSLNVTSYDPKEVLWQAKELMCTDLQALYAIVEYEGFMTAFRGTLVKRYRRL